MSLSRDVKETFLSKLDAQSSTILVVDDDRRVSFLLSSILTSAGHGVIVAEDGYEALDQARERKPDLILLDVMMPRLDGFETCRRLKSDEAFKHTPVIFITSMDDPKDVVRGFEAGASDYVAKPINAAVLLARVASHLRLHHALLELERLKLIAFDANPSTGLPGNNSIAESISMAIKDGRASCVIYADLDNFKAFNDKYGFARGDGAIKFTAETIKEGTLAAAGEGAFIGHVGGDDFVMIVPSSLAGEVTDQVIGRFDAGIIRFYDPKDAEAGKIVSKDRRGRTSEFPIMTISLCGVHLQERKFEHFLEVASVCAELKEVAKANPGSCVFFDRRKT